MVKIVLLIESETDNLISRKDTTMKNSLMKDGSYTGAFYCATIIICNLGYGNVPPGSTFEILLICIVWIVSRLLLVLLIGKVQPFFIFL